MDGFAFIFCRKDSVQGLGHVGFGFQTTPRGTYSFGSMDNGANPLAGYNGVMDGTGFRFWTDAGSKDAMLERFKKDEYDFYKYILVRPANPEGAQDVVLKSCSRTYFPAGSNCMNVAYDVLQAYGVGNLPYPIVHWSPNDWIKAFGGAQDKL